MKKFAYSSDIYHIKIEELLDLTDAQFEHTPLLPTNDVILFIGQEKQQQIDALAQGREKLKVALACGETHYPTRIMFEQRVQNFSVFALLKPIRSKHQDYSIYSYEILLSDIIENKLERNIKTEETAYNYSQRNQYSIPEAERSDRFHKIDASFAEHGYDKRYPMAIMLCRSLGVKDKLHQGHHRMYFCRKYNVKYVQVKFLACNSFTGQFKRLFLWLNTTLKYKEVT